MNRKRIYNLRYRRKHGKRLPHQALMICLKEYYKTGVMDPPHSAQNFTCLVVAVEKGYLQDTYPHYIPTEKGKALYEKYINKYDY